MLRPLPNFARRILPLFAILLASAIWHLYSDPEEALITIGWFVVLTALIAIGIRNDAKRERQLATARAERDGSEETLHQFLDNLPALACVKDPDGRVLAANRAFRQSLGLDPMTLLGKRADEIFDDGLGERILAEDLLVIKNGAPRAGIETFGGRQFESIRFPIPRKSRLPYLGTIAVDITDRLKVETLLHESELRLRLIGDNLPDSYIFQLLHTTDGRTLFPYVGASIERIHGLSPDSVTEDADTLLSRLENNFRSLFEASIHSSLTDLTDLEIEIQARRADSNWGWLRIRARPRRLADGATIWDGVATDVTTEHEIREALGLQVMRAGIMLSLQEKAADEDRDMLVRSVLDQLKQITESPIAFMHMIGGNGNSHEQTIWSPTIADRPSDVQTAFGELNVEVEVDAALHGQTVVSNQIETPVDDNQSGATHHRIRRLAIVPVIDGTSPRLLVGVANKEGNYSDTDVETLQLIGVEVYRILRQGQIEAALKVAEQVVSSSPAVCFRWRAEDGWPVVYVSDNVRRWGYTPDRIICGAQPYSGMVHPDDLQRVVSELAKHSAAGDDSYSQEYRLRTADGNFIDVLDVTAIVRDESGAPRFYDGVVTDISDRVSQERILKDNLAAQHTLIRKLEEAHNQLLQSEKMASIGQLAAGVAHELNNPIGFVHSNLGTLEGYLRDLMDIVDAGARIGDPPQALAEQREGLRRLMQDRDLDYLREDIFNLLAESRDGLGRVKQIVQDLKNFSRVGEQDWQWCDLHQGIDSTLNIVWNELKYKCTVIKDYQDIPKIHCLISQLNQVFMNLLVNASQAIESRGEIIIRTRRIDNDAVTVEISDTGAGIPEANLKRIFDPFFTTKPIGTGTGLGLSLSYSIIERHHGKIEVTSAVGKGTTFRITLPVDGTEQRSNGETTETKQ